MILGLNSNRDRYLTDKGIKQAIDAGILGFDPSINDRQLQPASLDLILQCRDGSAFPLNDLTAVDNVWRTPDHQIPAHSEVDLLATQKLQLQAPLYPITDLRSSLRRLGFHVPIPATMLGHLGYLQVSVHNPTKITINLVPGDKIAQSLFKFNVHPDVSYYENGLDKSPSQAARNFYELQKFDYGWCLEPPEAFALLKQGYFSVHPEPSFERNLLRVHAGKTARVLRKPIEVDFAAKQDISDCFEEVSLPYTVMPGEYVDIETRESLELSQHIGMHFFNMLLGTSTLSLETHSRERVYSDSTLALAPGGRVDPGYCGAFSRQTKTFMPEGATINEGDCIGLGFIIFYPTGVERPYGSKGLNSHYQGAEKTEFTQVKDE